jgi:peroxiredoxin
MDAMIKIGEQAPQFELPDLRGHLLRLEDLQGKIVVVNFWSAECEWCQRVDRELIPYLDAWKDRVKVLWIASNDSEPHNLIEKVASERKLPTVLVDDQQKVADLYGAQTTPHFFVVDSGCKLSYQGAWNDVTFRRRIATQVYVPKVIEALKQNLTPEVTQTPPYGCVLVRFAVHDDFSE